MKYIKAIITKFMLDNLDKDNFISKEISDTRVKQLINPEIKIPHFYHAYSTSTWKSAYIVQKHYNAKYEDLNHTMHDRITVKNKPLFNVGDYLLIIEFPNNLEVKKTIDTSELKFFLYEKKT